MNLGRVCSAGVRSAGDVKFGVEKARVSWGKCRRIRRRWWIPRLSYRRGESEEVRIVRPGCGFQDIPASGLANAGGCVRTSDRVRMSVNRTDGCERRSPGDSWW